MATILLPTDFKEFLQLLNEQKVEYLVIGGYAVAYHGYPRTTGDMDVWVARHEQNTQRIVAALEAFGFGAATGGVRRGVPEAGSGGADGQPAASD